MTAHVVDLSTGQVHAPAPDGLAEVLERAHRDPRLDRYTDNAGLPELRAAVAGHYARDFGAQVDPARITVFAGGRPALHQALLALLRPGDEVLVPQPYWSSYPALVRLAAGRIVPVAARGRRRVTVADLEAVASERTRVLILNTPANPTGAVYPSEELATIGEWAARRGVRVLIDELYAQLTWSVPATSVLSTCPELAAGSVLVGGLSKGFAMAGWRVGWTVAAPDVTAAIAQVQHALSGNAPNITQLVAAHLLTEDPDRPRRIAAELATRLPGAVAAVDALPGLRCRAPQAGIYLLAQVDPAGLRRGLVPAGGVGLAARLLAEAGVRVHPGENYGLPDHLRLCFAVEPQVLQEGLCRLHDWFDCLPTHQGAS